MALPGRRLTALAKADMKGMKGMKACCFTVIDMHVDIMLWQASERRLAAKPPRPSAAWAGDVRARE